MELPLQVRARILDDGRLVYLRFSGVQTAGLAINELQRLRSLPEYRPGLPELADLSRITRDDLDFHAMRRLAREANRESQNSDGEKRIALYAPKDVTYGMARMFSTLCDLDPGPATGQAFLSQREALAWLGRPETCFDDLPGMALCQ